MTTIAYKDGILAGDTQSQAGGYITDPCQKVFNIDGTLLGLCGDACMIEFFKDWVQENCDPSVLKDIDMSYTIIVVPPKGTKFYIYTDSTGVFRDTYLKKNPFAMGSGGDIALGAMQVGATSEEAVKAATQIDIRSGGKINVVVHDA